MEEQQQGCFVDVAVGDVLWGAGEHWKNDSKLATRSHTVTAVRPKTILISGAEGSPWKERATRIQRVESNPTTVANGAVGRSAYGGFLYRTEQDAVRAAVRSAEQDVDRAEIRLEAAQNRAASARQALEKLTGGAAALLVALVAVVALVAPSPAAAQSSGFSQYISTPSVAGRATITANGYFKRTTAPRRATGRVTFILYRAAGPGFAGTRIKVIERTLRPGQNRVDVSFSVRRTATSRVWTWFGFVRYSVSVPGRSTRYFEGTGRSALYRVR